MELSAIYADGGVIGKNPSSDGGTWGWCFTNRYGLRINGDYGYLTPDLFGEGPITNNVTELYALLLALEAAPDHWCGPVYSDSGITLGRLRTWRLPPGAAWSLHGVPRALQLLVWRQVDRLDWEGITWHLLDGHPTHKQLESGRGKRGGTVSPHNVWCDRMCNLAKDRFRSDQQEVSSSASLQAARRFPSPMWDSFHAERRSQATTTTGGSATPIEVALPGC